MSFVLSLIDGEGKLLPLCICNMRYMQIQKHSLFYIPGAKIYKCQQRCFNKICELRFFEKNNS